MTSCFHNGGLFFEVFRLDRFQGKSMLQNKSPEVGGEGRSSYARLISDVRTILCEIMERVKHNITQIRPYFLTVYCNVRNCPDIINNVCPGNFPDSCTQTVHDFRISVFR